MAADTGAEAVERFVAANQRIVSCVTLAVLLGRPNPYAQPPYLLRFDATEGVRVGRRGHLVLRVRIWYDVARLDSALNWAVAIAGYEYRLRLRDGPSVLSYHWHPTGPSSVTAPHLHVGGRTAPLDLSKAHLPTGAVSLAAVVRLTIADLGVDPLRPDWRGVLEGAEQSLAG